MRHVGPGLLLCLAAACVQAQSSLQTRQAQAREDRQIVNTLASQNHITVNRNRAVRFFSSNEAQLRSAIQITDHSSGSPRTKERVQFVVVE